MKPLVVSFICLFTIFAFTQKIETNVFKSPKNTLSIELAGNWTAAANMKGIDILLESETVEGSIKSVLTVSSVEGLKEETDINKFSGRKITLQTSVLDAKIESTGQMTILEQPAKYFEYSYKNDNLNTLKTKVVFVVINQIGYQLSFTTLKEEFDTSVPLFNQAVQNFKLL